MKRFTMGFVTVLTGAVLAACGATPTTGTGTTAATSAAGTSATTSADTSATSSADTSATMDAGMDMGATTEATSAAGTDAMMEADMGATTEATSAAGTDATSSAGTSATTSATTGAGTSATADATSAAGTGATTAAGTSEADSLLAVATEQGNLTTLLTALQATGLDQQLSSLGSYTLFAPTDEAFAALPAGAVEALLADPTVLTQILSYHVSDQNLMAADVAAATSITTLEGQPITVSASGGTVTLNGDTTVTTTDIETTNGTIHLIDKVLLPPNVTLPSGS